MSVKCYETVYKNYGKCICLENGKIRLIATVEVGPRIIFFGFCNGENVLFEDIDRNFYILNRNYGVWYAYGGHRLWLAPEEIPETYSHTYRRKNSFRQTIQYCLQNVR